MVSRIFGGHFSFHPLLGLFALAATAVLVILVIVNEMVSKKPLEEASVAAIASSNLATNNLRNAEVIAAMGMLPNLISRWYKLNSRFLQLQAEASQKAGGVGAISKFVRISMQSFILGLGALLVLEGKITPGNDGCRFILHGQVVGAG